MTLKQGSWSVAVPGVQVWRDLW